MSTHAAELKIGDLFVCEAGDMIAADGEIVEGIATVDESAITASRPLSSVKAAAIAAPSPAEPR